MSNEELAALAKQGDRDAAAVLWEQTYRLIYKLMGKYAPLCAQCGIEMEDLRQAGYLAMIRAVNAYDPDKSTLFTSYLGYHVSNAARETLGYIGRTRLPPVPRSLSEPLDMEGITLEDTITDPDGAAPFDQVEEDIYNQQLRDALEECLGRLTPEQSGALRDRFYRGIAVSGMASERGIPPHGVKKMVGRSLLLMRTGRNAARLRGFRADIISRAHRNVGYTAFSASWYSSVEWAAERLTE
jgi:RNA polymerase sigma factor (sigma-70 family)